MAQTYKAHVKSIPVIANGSERLTLDFKWRGCREWHMTDHKFSVTLHTSKEWTSSVGKQKGSSTFDVKSSMLHLPHYKAVLHGHAESQVW